MTHISVKGWIVTEQVRRDKKERKETFCSKTMCTHSKWANEQILKTELCIFLASIYEKYSSVVK